MTKLIYIVCFAFCFHVIYSQEDVYLNTERNQRLLEFKPDQHILLKAVRSLTNLVIKNDMVDEGTHSENDRSQFEGIQDKDDHGGEEQDSGDLLGRIQILLENLKLTKDEDVSDRCLNDTQRLLTGIRDEEIWALGMLDATGKPGSGILRGQMDWLGSYDECFRVNLIISKDVDFKSRYCTVNLLSDELLNQTVAPLYMAVVYLGLCLPDTCSNMDITTAFTDLLKSMNLKYVTTADCHQEHLPLDTKAIVAIVICSLFGCLVILGTMYDTLLQSNMSDTETLPKGSQYGALSDGQSNPAKDVDTKKPLLSESTSLSVKESQVVLETEINTSLKLDGKESQATEQNKGIWLQLLLTFSAYTNGAKLLNTKQPPGNLTAVHGIRFLSMSWVILGHAFSVVMGFGSEVWIYLQEHIKWWTFHGILNALVSVDTFFTLSGLLVTYLTMKEMKRRSGKINWFMFYFHRFWRLTPVYMMMLMFYACLYLYLGDGPLWSPAGIAITGCEDNWWTNLLYVNNLVNRDQMCFSWSWYLANDMQFYLLSPIILIPLYFSQYLGMAVMGLFLVGTMTTAGIISRLNNLPVGFVYMTEGTPGPDDYAAYYMTPYCRMGPYLVGMMAGYLLHKHEGKTMSKKMIICGWLVATASALAVLYGPYDSANGTPMTSDVAALYNAVHRTVWGAAVSWVVVACATGSGGFVNTLLSWKGFVPLSRLSYCAYLTHPMVVILQYMTQRSVFYITDIGVVYNFLGFLVATYGVSVIVSLVFEAPMLGLERVLLKRERRN